MRTFSDSFRFLSLKQDASESVSSSIIRGENDTVSIKAEAVTFPLWDDLSSDTSEIYGIGGKEPTLLETEFVQSVMHSLDECSVKYAQFSNSWFHERRK